MIVSVPHAEVEPSAWRRFLEKVKAAAHEELAAGTHVGLNDFGFCADVEEARDAIVLALRNTAELSQFIRNEEPRDKEREEALLEWEAAEAKMEQAEVALNDALDKIRDA